MLQAIDRQIMPILALIFISLADQEANRKDIFWGIPTHICVLEVDASPLHLRGCWDPVREKWLFLSSLKLGVGRHEGDEAAIVVLIYSKFIWDRHVVNE